MTKSIRLFCLLSCLAASQPSMAAMAPAWYANGGLGIHWLTGKDANAYFHQPGSAEPGFGTGMRLGGALNVGYQFACPLALEAGIGLGPDKSYQVDYTNPSGKSTVQTTWTSYSYYLAPVARFSGYGPMFHGPYVHGIGLKLGLSSLAGRVDVHISPANQDGAYEQSSTAFYGGLFYRFEQTFNDHLSGGLEVGYDLNRFTYLVNSNPSGTFAGGSKDSPETNFDGSTTEVDFSGPFLRVTFSYWLTAPVQAEKTSTVH